MDHPREHPRDVALLTNPAAGSGRGARHAALALPALRRAGIRVRSLTGRDAAEARDLAAAAVADGIDTLVVCGGDGLVHLALDALGDAPVPLGIIPAGTGNDVARYLDLPRRDPVAAAAVISSGRTRRIDLGEVAGRRFATVVAAGFDAKVNERANRMRRPRGQSRYTLATVAELGVLAPVPYVLELDGRTVRTSAVVVAVGNGPSFGGGLRITEGADLHDGLLDVVVIGPISRPDLVRTYPKLFRGTHVDHPAYQHFRAREVTVAAPGIVAYADGERIGPLPLTVRTLPGALTVWGPR